MLCMRVAAVQYRPPKGEPGAARLALIDAVAQAGRDGARIIVCPEMATTGYIWTDAATLLPHAEPADGPTAVMLGEAAARVGAWVFCGFAEQDGDQLYNAMVILDPTGRRVATYRKVLLYQADETWAAQGEQRWMIQTTYGDVAPGICMDLNDDGFIEVLTAHSPRFCAFSTSWVDEGEDPLDYWRFRLRAWSGWFIAGNTWGEDEGITFAGRSTILGPDGRAHARAPFTGDTVIMAEVD